MAQVPTHFAVIDTPLGIRHVLLKLSAGGFTHYTTFRLYKYDQINMQISNNYVEIRAKRIRHSRYAPYLYNEMGLICFGISAGLISYSDQQFEQEDLDALFIQFKEQYDSGIIDTNLIIAP